MKGEIFIEKNLTRFSFSIKKKYLKEKTMQTFYDELISTEGKKETSEDWKIKLTQVELKQLSVVEETVRGWKAW